MKLIADLHIHGKYSQATSKDITIATLEKYSRMKGVNLIGTGDFTHPKWIQELKSNLIDDGTGIFKTKTGFNFLLQTEISQVYTQGGKGRRVHNIVLAPDFSATEKITQYLLKFGRVDYDGRPIFKISCPQFVHDLKQIDERIEIIPAHIWTPWFGLLGSKTGFDSVKEAFQDQAKKIFALETGLSSDPAMNWRLKSLDKYTLVSNSDLHSYWPWRLGREANLFDIKELTYASVIKAIKTRKGFSGTIEVDPNYGKYHFDGHRACNFCSDPEKTKTLGGVCPVCKKPLTIGVMYRVEELADKNRAEGFVLKGAPGFKTLLPLSDLITLVNGQKVGTKKSWEMYNLLVNEQRNEFDILLNTSENELLKIGSEKLVKLIMDNRNTRIKVNPGYDGQYGVPVVEEIGFFAKNKIASRKSKSHTKKENNKNIGKKEKENEKISYISKDYETIKTDDESVKKILKSSMRK